MPNWEEIRKEWETAKITLAELAAKHDIKLGTLKSRKSREKWLRDKTEKDATKTAKVATVKEDAAEEKEVVESEEVIAFDLEGDDGLTDKQRLFCMFYVRSLNATSAYKKAYKSSYATAMSEGSRFTRNPKIKAKMAELKKERLEQEDLDKMDVLQKYKAIAFADITDFIDFTQVTAEATETTVEFNPDGSKKSEKTEIVPYTYTKFSMQHSEEIDGTLITELSKGKDGMFKVKLADKMAAMAFLAKYTDLLNENERKQLQNEQAKLNIGKTKAEIKNIKDGNKNQSAEDWVAALGKVAERRKVKAHE
ncbi:terminase small subunit [Lysinibacillus sp. CNPSo 3705]|uniref:terminase small subunit n=1 Tax=Lysinibacillus sp. CNPSo 3705 TaxID=3028148 RepID=UPI002363DDA9|nr:terminase small subunit [Lysinibacillus sp. CNPSo 3705]MDD1504259.1 terminase small subunit [Lysinibacillus sp. CNPSo 3705]